MHEIYIVLCAWAACYNTTLSGIIVQWLTVTTSQPSHDVFVWWSV